jgi:hypothetical protein
MRGNYGSRFIVDGDVLLRKHDLSCCGGPSSSWSDGRDVTSALGTERSSTGEETVM